MKFLLLALGLSVIFAAWQWFRPYEWSPDPAARYKVTQCMVERDHGNLWLRVFLKPRDGQEMDYLKPIRLTTGAGSVAVAPAFQGRKLGIRLLDFADEQARSWDVPEVRLYTNSRMERNIALYAAYGYRETGRRANPYRPGWTLVDMAKPVDRAA